MKNWTADPVQLEMELIATGEFCGSGFFFVAFLYTVDVQTLDFYIFRIDVIYKIEYHIHK